MCATLPIRSRSAIANDEIESVVRGRRNSGPRSELRGFCLDVRSWHLADNATAPTFAAIGVTADKGSARGDLSAYDPQRTWDWQSIVKFPVNCI